MTLTIIGSAYISGAVIRLHRCVHSLVLTTSNNYLSSYFLEIHISHSMGLLVYLRNYILEVILGFLKFTRKVRVKLGESTN